MQCFFVAGIGTDVGKTFFTASIAQYLINLGFKVLVLKPVISGWNDIDNDVFTLLNSINLNVNEQNINLISKFRFKHSLAPNMAASLENKIINFDEIVEFCHNHIRDDKYDFLFIESAGGIMSPITNDKTCLDLLNILDISVIMVSNIYLGSISHLLTAVRCTSSISAVIINDYQSIHVEYETYIKCVRNFINHVIIPMRNIKNDDSMVKNFVDIFVKHNNDYRQFME